MYSELKNIRQIRVIFTEILIILVNEHKIGNISVNMAQICLIFCTSEQIFLRVHQEYFYNFIYFTYKILRVSRRYLWHKISVGNGYSSSAGIKPASLMAGNP